jgi:hypothetical protein
MKVPISCLSSEEVYHRIWELSLESLRDSKWHNHVILCMPDMYLRSERSEGIIVLRGREVSCRDTCCKEMYMIDEKRVNFPSDCIRYTSIMLFQFTEILQEEASTKRSSYEGESITCIELFHDRFEYDLPVFIFGIELIRENWHDNLISLGVPLFCDLLNPGSFYLWTPGWRLPIDISFS